METPLTEIIMDHTFENGFCTKCGRKRGDLVAYGDPNMKIATGDTGLSCSGHTNAAELESLREAWKRDQAKYAAAIRF